MNKTIVLTGDNLTVEQVIKVAKEGYKVEISPEARQRLVDARQLVFDLVDADFPIYGFNVGVGWNKDKKVFKEFFTQYNCNLIRSHSISVPPYASEEEVRAIMLARLNTMLVGCTGVAPEIPETYANMLNLGIHPLIPERGSVGQADIGLLSHIGLAIIGEGNVNYRGKTMPSKEAFKEAGLIPCELGPKDGLAIVSSNAMAAGQGAMLLDDIDKLLTKADIIYAMSLEGMNGNTAPLNDKAHELRRFAGQRESAKLMSEHLEGSYIYDPDPDKIVHDPLSFRNAAHIHGAVREILEYTKQRLEVQLNTTDDNPCLLLEERTIIPSANFEPINWVLGFESLAIALSHVSKASCNRTMKLSNPAFTKLPRFLSPRDDTLGFATVQKTFTAMDAEIRHLCNPCSMDTFSLAGDMEDMSCNSPYVVQNLRRIVDDLKYVLALEMIHAAQAMDYRKGKKFGKHTKPVYERLRQSVPFYEIDRNITADIITVYDLINGNDMLNALQ